MASGNDMKAHNSTYDGFIGMVKYGTVAAVLATVLVILAIV